MSNCVFQKEEECLALKEKQCLGCTFHKTSEELAEGRQKATRHINSLPEHIKKKIARKYYG